MTNTNIAQWSQTPASNTDLNTIEMRENLMRPRDVNNWTREELSQLAKFYADLGGVNTVAGSGDAITVTTAEVFTALTTGLVLVFKAPATNTTNVTINVDGLGAKAIRKFTTAEAALVAGDLVIGGKYLIVYDATANAAAGAWIVLNAAGSSISLAANMATFLATPSSANLRATMTDESGTGAAYFQGGDLGTPSAGVLTNATGTAASLTSGITQALKSATTTVDVSAATAPSANQVLTATDSTHATWVTPTGGARTLLATLTTTSGSTVTSGTLATTYTAWEVDLDNVTYGGASATLSLNISSDGGGTFDTAIGIAAAGGGAAYSGKAWISRTSVTAAKILNAITILTGTATIYGGRFATKTSATNCIRITCGGGTFSAGAAYIYGVP